MVTEYIELGQSAMDDDRPIFQSMLEDLSQEPKPAEAILIHTTSRFMRNASHARMYKRDLEERGIQVIAVMPDAATLC